MWKTYTLYTFGAIIVILTVSLIVFIVSWKSGCHLTKNCLVINDVTPEQLNENVNAIILVTSKLFPVVCTTYTSHWSIVCETDKGYYNISTARYMSISVTKVTERNPYEFMDERWDTKLNYQKKYHVSMPVTIIGMMYAMLKEYCNNGMRSKYSIINHNCHHAVIDTIKKYAVIREEDDKYLDKLKGLKLIKTSMKDAFVGPSADLDAQP